MQDATNPSLRVQRYALTGTQQMLAADSVNEDSELVSPLQPNVERTMTQGILPVQKEELESLDGQGIQTEKTIISAAPPAEP